MRGFAAQVKAVLVFTLLILGAASFFVQAQFTPKEIAQRPEWENFLKTAEIVSSKEIGEGVTKPYKLHLKKGDIEKDAAWKNPSGWQQGFWEGWQYEIAAYRMDKLIGLNMIPPYIEREFKGQKGALSLWAESKTSLLKMMEQGIKIPPAAADQTEKMKYVTRAFDSLIANEDRTQQNVLFTEDWRTILIDHSRSFRCTKECTEKLMFGSNGLKRTSEGRPFLFRQLPRAFVEKVRALTYTNVQSAVGPYLTDEEIKAIIIRKDLLLKEIEGMIKEKGEDKVLY
jgi:hypothetical protein